MVANKQEEIRGCLPEIKEIKHILQIVKDYGEMPKGKAWKFSQYKNMGLIAMHTKKTERGSTIFGKLYLTKKGRELESSFTCDI